MQERHVKTIKLATRNSQPIRIINPQKKTMNRIKYILGVGCLLMTSIIFAQDFLPTDDVRYQEIKGVYEKLSMASGISRTPPTLRVEDEKEGKRIIANYDKGIHTITTEIELYELLQQTYQERADDALAIILGHELAHFYQNHNHHSGHNCSTHDLSSRQEAEADKLGLYYTFQAGYQTADIANNVIGEVYKFYQLNENGECGYPDLEERDSIMQVAIIEVRESVEFYKTANFLMMLQEYQKAAILYEYVTKSFPTAELFNNIGVAYARMGIEKTNLTLQYPLLIEEFTVLSNQNIDAINPAEDNRTTLEYYNRAKIAFKQAVNLEEKYALSYLNLTCLSHLIQIIDTEPVNIVNRNHYLEHYGLNIKNKAYYYLMKAIIHYDENQIKAAKKMIQKAKVTNNNALIRANHCIINKKDCNIPTRGLELQPIAFKTAQSKSVWVEGANYFAEIHTVKTDTLSDNYYLQFDIANSGGKYYWEQRKYEVQEIKGLSKDKIEAKMGQPDLIILTKEHEIFLYQGSELLLFFIGDVQEKYHYRYRIIQR
jgi:tetratricopeptide (TPR) repeat protein